MSHFFGNTRKSLTDRSISDSLNESCGLTPEPGVDVWANCHWVSRGRLPAGGGGTREGTGLTPYPGKSLKSN